MFRSLITNYAYICVIIIQLLTLTVCLYEDQIGKFDWKQSYIGQLNDVLFMPQSVSSHSIVMSTKSDVLASLMIRNGSIIWRHKLESPIEAIGNGGDECPVMTINDNGKRLRCWSRDGVLMSENSLPYELVDPIENEGDVILYYYIDHKAKDVKIAKFIPKKKIVEIIKYDIKLKTIKTIVSSISVLWYHESLSCDFITSNAFVCLDSSDLIVQYLSIGDSTTFTGTPLSVFGLHTQIKPKYFKIIKLPFQEYVSHPHFAIDLGGDGIVVLRIQQNQIKLIKVLPKIISVTIAPSEDSDKLILWVFMTKENPIPDDDDPSSLTGIKLVAFDLNNWSEISSYSGQFIIDGQILIDKFYIIPLMRSDSKRYFKILISTKDATLMMGNLKGKINWKREESLAMVVSSEILDLPLSELDAKIEQTFGFDNTNFIKNFLTRISTQLYQLQQFSLSIAAQITSSLNPKHLRRKVSENDDEYGDSSVSDNDDTSELALSLVRDDFGLHKIIVTLSENGKLFGIDSVSGRIIWSIYEPQLRAIGKKKLAILVQRTAAHYPHPAQCSIINKFGFILSFNPITGEIHDRITLDTRVLQTMLMSHYDNTYIRPILILNDKFNPIVYPSSAESLFLKLKNSYFMLTADETSSVLRGFSFEESDTNDLKSHELWSLGLPQPLTDLQVVFKKYNEHVHSQGRVMGDRNVLYKYLNPNLITVITEAIDSQDKPFINVYLIDTITGAVIYTTVHRRAKGPVHIVHSENWIIYSYYNEKSRRTEISSIELYEGTSYTNTTAFSSLAREELTPAIIEHQTFIFPTGIDVMVDTITERGITNKHILIILPSGGLLELPKAFLDPRRPINPTPEHREEGLIPYIPELPIPSEGIINYNQSLTSIRGIQTAPTNLESTCLVFAFGLDLFYTRVTPSKTFDILKDDFDHILISAVLISLLVFSYLSKWLASRKTLKSAWK